MATDLSKLMAGKMQMEAALQAEIRQTARDVYVALLAPYLSKVVYGDKDIHGMPPLKVTPSAIKELAALAWKSAPYLHQAAGMVQVDDEQLWGDGK